MKIRTQLRRRLVRCGALALALAGIAAPTAQAGGNFYEPFSPADNTLISSTGQGYENFYQPFSPTDKTLISPTAQGYENFYQPFSPTPGVDVGPIVSLPHRPTVDAALLQRGDRDRTVETTPVQIAAPGSFNWSDALAGAGIGAGICLLAAGALLAFRRRAELAHS